MILNRMLCAATGRAAAEPILDRSDPDRPNMGLTTLKGVDSGRPLRKAGAGTARNYLGEPKILSDRPGRSGYSPTPTSCIMIDQSMHEFPDLNRRYPFKWPLHKDHTAIKFSARFRKKYKIPIKIRGDDCLCSNGYKSKWHARLLDTPTNIAYAMTAIYCSETKGFKKYVRTNKH